MNRLRPKMINSIRFLCLLGVLCSATTRLHAATTLLPYGSGWFHFDDGYLPAENWAQDSYDYGDWSYGYGQFGYGDGDENTVIYYGPDDEHKNITTYFRSYVYIA